MADFCAKCGATLASTSGFCSSCGVSVAARAAPSRPVPLTYVPQAGPPAVVGSASVPPSRSSGGSLKAILIMVAVVVGIGILGAGAFGYKVWRFSKSLPASNKTNDALFSIPGLGSISTGSDATADPSQLGAPIYPGAAQEKGAVSVGTSAAGMVEAHFTTIDPMSQVAAFYTSNMAGAIVASTGSGTVINAGPSATDRVTVTISPGSGSNAGKTTIVIVHAAKN
jgi:hypothetical protein